MRELGMHLFVKLDIQQINYHYGFNSDSAFVSFLRTKTSKVLRPGVGEGVILVLIFCTYAWAQQQLFTTPPLPPPPPKKK